MAALAGIGIGLAPDQERSSVSESTSFAPVTTVTPSAQFVSPTVESDDASTTSGQSNEGIAIAPTGVPADAQRAVVRRIVDGDTLAVAAVTAGPALDSTSTVDVRLLEINAPETKDPNTPVQCFGPEATAELTRLAPVGSTVWVQRDQELRDRYGRYLLYMWDPRGEFVNLSLVQSGHAEAVLYQPNDKHWSLISAAEPTARATNAGGWGTCPAFGDRAQEMVTTQPPTPAPQNAPPPPPPPLTTPLPPPPKPSWQPPAQTGLPNQRMGPDTDCSDYPGPVAVAPGDPHRLDRDGDGIGCDANG
ncbi:thermonuclease family protein [Nocardia sp. FBN12]|uniref:thermonuclease family protein n=1 Tax=Nocardia sp. FBN12 TaxID=3419766 RepID=UPI003CFC8AEA